MIDWQPRASAYAKHLADAVAITDPAWTAAFERV